ncbi:hypothetical protein OQA88_4468 [Cercophora sp. LCS_1]
MKENQKELKRVQRLADKHDRNGRIIDMIGEDAAKCLIKVTQELVETKERRRSAIDLPPTRPRSSKKALADKIREVQLENDILSSEIRALENNDTALSAAKSTVEAANTALETQNSSLEAEL